MCTSAPRPDSADPRRRSASQGVGRRPYPTLGRIRGSGPYPARWSPFSTSSDCLRTPTATIRPNPRPAPAKPADPKQTGGPQVSGSRSGGTADVGRSRTRLIRMLFFGLVVFAGVVPALIPEVHHHSAHRAAVEDVAWPKSFEGYPLARLSLSAVDRRFADRFPGQIARFTDGRRILIARTVQEPTQMLHPASVCFRGLGYRVGDTRAAKDDRGITWGCFLAERNGEQYRVCERIYDQGGGAWTDVSSWYWAALLGRTERPWHAMTVVTPR
jgi:hypothetical protein